MADDNTLREMGSQFEAMSLVQKQLFLSTYAHQITILARGGFADSDFESARLCNETLHRVAGFMAAMIGDPVGASYLSFIEMLAAGARQRGWEEILRRSMETAQRRSLP